MLGCFGTHLLLHFLPLFFIEHHFTHPDVLGRNLDALVVLDVFHAFFQRQQCFRSDANGIVASAGPVVGEFLCFGSVHHQVARLDVFGDDLAGVYILSRVNKECTPVLQFIDGLSGRLFRVLG